jgi:hypothetical protein
MKILISLPPQLLDLPGVNEWLLQANKDLLHPQNIKRILMEQRKIIRGDFLPKPS